jgi:hypothetical protein
MQDNLGAETKNKQTAPVVGPNLSDNKPKPKKPFFNKSDGMAFLQIGILCIISSIIWDQLGITQVRAIDPSTLSTIGIGMSMPFVAIFMFITHEISYTISKLIPWRFKHLLYPVFVFCILLVAYWQTGSDTVKEIGDRTDFFSLYVDPRILSLSAFVMVLLSSFIVLWFYICRLAKEESLLATPTNAGTLSKKMFFPFVLVLLIVTYFSPLPQKIISLAKIQNDYNKQVILNEVNVEVLKNKLPSECSLGVISGVVTKYASINCNLGNTTSDTGQVWPLSWKGTVEAGQPFNDSKVISTSSYIPDYKYGPFADVGLTSGVTAKTSSSSYPEGGLASIDLYWMDHNHRFSLGGQFQTTEGLYFKTETVGNYNLTDYTKKIATIILSGVTYNN